ncbi:hypothetical protein [Flavivirga jejuensis]|uniref:Uncharacterized protein n=1 Tax=Flavivirga jejuensis TaxID=870487 RepID=A0ABT8WJS8_9FLAO|nr:hypothetical protein [Flavivirga jejuensis]MDO5973412.1 hypothetical protein [Flavivirga jejuensis]
MKRKLFITCLLFSTFAFAESVEDIIITDPLISTESDAEWLEVFLEAHVPLMELYNQFGEKIISEKNLVNNKLNIFSFK